MTTTTEAEAKDRRVLVLSPEDNVCIACVYLKQGDTISIDGTAVTLAKDIPIGHKLARKPLKAGDKVFRWGAPIGSMVADASLGAHVHVHNMKSDYIPTFTFEKGRRFFGDNAS